MTVGPEGDPGEGSVKVGTMREVRVLLVGVGSS